MGVCAAAGGGDGDVGTSACDVEAMLDTDGVQKSVTLSWEPGH